MAYLSLGDHGTTYLGVYVDGLDSSYSRDDRYIEWEIDGRSSGSGSLSAGDTSSSTVFHQSFTFYHLLYIGDDPLFIYSDFGRRQLGHGLGFFHNRLRARAGTRTASRVLFVGHIKNIGREFQPDRFRVERSDDEHQLGTVLARANGIRMAVGTIGRYFHGFRLQHGGAGDQWYIPVLGLASDGVVGKQGLRVTAQ